MEWISVKDRLPDSKYKKQIVFVKLFYAPSYIHVSTYRDGKWTIMKEDGSVGKVTHWMPLPEPPK